MSLYWKRTLPADYSDDESSAEVTVRMMKMIDTIATLTFWAKFVDIWRVYVVFLDKIVMSEQWLR